MDRERTACVIGASGFIGSQAVLALRRAGFAVRAAVRRPQGPLPAELREPGVEVVQADVTDDPTVLARVFRGAEVVVNCAGIYRWWVADAAEYERVNKDGAAHVAQACLLEPAVVRLVHISTAMAFGYPADRPFCERSAPGPHASEYARTKHLGDVEVSRICKGSRLAVVTLFLACVTGRGDTFSVGRPAAVYRDFLRGRIPMLVAPDTNFIYVHIQDVQNAIVRASTMESSKVDGESFLIGNSKDMLTTRQYFEMLSRHTGRPCPSLTLNLSVAYWLAVVVTWISTRITGSEPAIPLDVIRTAKWGSIEYDCRKSVETLGLSYTPIDAAVAEGVRHVKELMRLPEGGNDAKLK